MKKYPRKIKQPESVMPLSRWKSTIKWNECHDKFTEVLKERASIETLIDLFCTNCASKNKCNDKFCKGVQTNLAQLVNQHIMRGLK